MATPIRASVDALGRVPFLVAVLLTLCLSGAAAADAVSLSEVARGLRVDGERISVSGISSGGYMAQQFHVAHSKHISGAGIIAGGPYRCAAGSYAPYTWFDMTGLYAATSRCSDTNPWWFYQGRPDVDFSIAETRREAAAGNIDGPDGMRDDRVWLLTGTRDTTVPPPVMDALFDYYSEFVDADNILYRSLDDAGHAMITDDFGNACHVSEPPFLNDCDFDAAGALLEYLLGPLAPPARRAESGSLVEFDQGEYFDEGEASVSMNELGHVYVPGRCMADEPCALHVAFHGCQQYQALIGDDFYTEAGYNEWAESNGIVVLYPQTTAWPGTFLGGVGNPKGCWDWWGYSGSDYHTRAAPQIRAVAAMVNTLVGTGLLP